MTTHLTVANHRARTSRFAIVFVVCLAGFLFGLDLIPLWLVDGDFLSGGNAVFLILLSAPVVGGGLYQLLRLTGDGPKVARALGGSSVPLDPSDDRLKRFRNVATEMAIAAAIPMPQLFVLESDEHINAFAAGPVGGKTVICVSRGALLKLTRDELQGVVAHETSHLKQNDVGLSKLLASGVFGLLCFTSLGTMVMCAGAQANSSGGSKKDKENAGGMIALGFVVMIAGGIGWLVAGILDALVSREMEFRADAEGALLASDTTGLVGALVKIGQESGKFESDGFSDHQRAVNPMFFGAAAKRYWFDSHPPLLARIHALDQMRAAQLLPPAEPQDPGLRAISYNKMLSPEKERNMDYWITHDGKNHGPYAEDELREWLKSGRIHGDALAWREGLIGWIPLYDVFPAHKMKGIPATPTAVQPVTSQDDNIKAATGSFTPITTVKTQDAKPFGLRMGMSLQDINGSHVQISPGAYMVVSVPIPDAAFESYGVHIGSKTGIGKVTGVGKSIATDASGTELKQAFTEMKTVLAGAYGLCVVMDQMQSDNICNEPGEWMLRLMNEERVLGAMWDARCASTLPPNVARIHLGVQATAENEGSLLISYEFRNIDQCMAEIAEEEQGLPSQQMVKNPVLPAAVPSATSQESVVNAVTVPSTPLTASKTQGAQPFGLQMGMPLKNVGGNPELVYGNYKTNVVPKPHSAFDSYLLTIGPTSGLSWIKANGKKYPRYGSAFQEPFHELRGKLESAYGKHLITHEPMPDNVINMSENLMTGLPKVVAILSANWSPEFGSSLPANLKQVLLTVRSFDDDGSLMSESAWLSLEYTFVNYDICCAELDELDEDEDEAL